MLVALLLAALAAGLLGASRPGTERAPPADTDGDGILDASDACPGAPGLAPEGCPPRDSDGDGVLDRADPCPDQAGPEANRGCPDRDGDGDGTVDRADRCPAQRGHADAAGCAPPDRDGDAVWDQDDVCPDSAEVWNGRSDRDGCPDAGRALVEVHPGLLALAAGRWFRRSGRLSSAGRDAAGVAAAALAAARARRVRIEITVPVSIERTAPASGGRSSEASLALARSQVGALAQALIRLRPGLHVERAAGGEGEPRVHLVFE